MSGAVRPAECSGTVNVNMSIPIAVFADVGCIPFRIDAYVQPVLLAMHSARVSLLDVLLVNAHVGQCVHLYAHARSHGS